MALALIVVAVGLAGCVGPAIKIPPRAPGIPPAESSSLEVDQPVAAKWTDGNLWLAKVVAVGSDRITVEFSDDHSQLAVAVSDVHPIKKKSWNVGDRVLAVWSLGEFYPGEIVAMDGDTYTVRWEDGTTPSEVTNDKIIAAP